MMKQAFFSLLFAFVAQSIFAQQKADFRNIRWGFTSKQVIESEPTKPFSKKKELLIYKPISLAGRRVGLDYEFLDGGLLSASYYYYVTASVTKDSVMAAAADFESHLTEKYGKGKARNIGDTKDIVWQTPRTQINLTLGNVDRGWSVEVRYLCRVCSGDAQTTGATPAEFKPKKEVKDF